MRAKENMFRPHPFHGGKLMSIERSIPIDGPAGSGKSTIAKRLSALLGMRYVSTGEMYRALALHTVRSKVDPSDAVEVSKLACESDIELIPTVDGGQSVFLNGEDVTSYLRTPEVDNIVSLVSLPEKVREVMARNQRKVATKFDVVMDGRDIGSVVLPEASCKFFLTADVEERARRRQKDYIASGRDIALDTIVEDLKRRDYIDSNREIAPLIQAEGAHFIDSTVLNIEEVTSLMYNLVKESLSI